MITAELIHNPYLLQTTVKFNGQAPRINSQVEKYESKTLQDWIKKIPSIFYDEMNGYDFDLYFTGTEEDFQNLRKAFFNAGVSEKLVRLIHKNELEGTETKCQEIDDLINWLRETPNRKFDFQAFFEEYGELFTGKYPYVVLGGSVAEEIHPQVGMEFLKDASELQNTVLTSTPILFYIDAESRQQAREDLQTILKRSDIQEKQLFFLIHPHLNAEPVKRVIMDLGVEQPQIVSDYGAESVQAYLRNYPMAEFIRESIGIFEQKTSEIWTVLDAENKESEILNKDIRQTIKGIEEQITKLKEADKKFTERDNFNTGHIFEDLCTQLREKINKWRNWKTKVVGDVECASAAREYDADLAKFMISFLADVKEAYIGFSKEIQHNFGKQYAAQGLDLGFIPDVVLEDCASCPSVSMAAQLMDLRVVTYEEPKKDIRALFRAADEHGKQRVVTCYYAQWREKALECIIPIANAFIEENINRLCIYYNLMAEAYHVHLAELLSHEEEKKDEVSAQLSDDERMLQEDNDWLTCFKEQLTHIERD